MKINFKTSGICCREMNFSVDENNTITDVEFVGGCNGNLSGMAKLLIGQNALEVAEKLEGTTCFDFEYNIMYMYIKSKFVNNNIKS